MKKILFLLFAAAIFIFAANASFFYRSVCDKPLAYKVGTIDARFNLSEDQVAKNLEAAANVWEVPSDRDLFAYDLSAILTVNFVYDRKQSLHSEITDLEKQLESGKGDLEAKKQEYQNQVANFEKRLAEHNGEVEKWNSQGGAPPEEYDKLIARQNELSQEANRLNAIAKELNLSAQEYNLGVGKLNKTISEFNADLKRRPEEGLFDGQTNTIEIYFVPSKNELVHTLAHELGHARGLGHTEGDENSIMFPYSSESVKATSEDIEALNILCRERSLPEIVRTNLMLVVERYRTSR